MINEFKTHMTDCLFKFVRRQSAARPAHDAEAEDIIRMAEQLEKRNWLEKVLSAEVALDRLLNYTPNYLRYVSEPVLLGDRLRPTA